MKVKIKYKDIRKNLDIFRNVTEIHYNFPSLLNPSIAFESDIHGTGCTRFIDDIKEFNTSLEINKAKHL